MKELIIEAISKSHKIEHYSSVEKITPLGGGCIHNAWCINFQNGKEYNKHWLVVKSLNPYFPQF